MRLVALCYMRYVSIKSDDLPPDSDVRPSEVLYIVQRDIDFQHM